MDFNYMAYKEDLNGNIISSKYQPIDCVIVISDDECDMLPDDEYIDVVGFEAENTEPQKDVTAPHNSSDVERDVIKPVSLEQRYYKAVPVTENSNKIQYGCSMCLANFSTAKKLYIHMRPFVESKNQDALQCKYCQKVLCSQRRLKEHVIGVHQGSRYKCNWCTKTYVNLTCFETHKIVAHSKRLTESLVSSKAESCSISPATFSSLLSQSSTSPTLPMSIQDWIPDSSQSNTDVYSTKRNTIGCRRHPDISHCICRLI